MSLEDKVDKLAEESYKFHGEVRQFMVNTTSYIGAVNAKVDVKDKAINDKLDGHLDEHREELKENQREGDKGRRDWFSIALALGMLILGVIEVVRAFGK